MFYDSYFSLLSLAQKNNLIVLNKILYFSSFSIRQKNFFLSKFLYIILINFVFL